MHQICPLVESKDLLQDRDSRVPPLGALYMPDRITVLEYAPGGNHEHGEGPHRGGVLF